MWEEIQAKKKGPEQSIDDIKIRLTKKQTYKLMQQKLTENDCRNRGYILDGFPRSFVDAQYVFLKRKKKTITNDEGEVVTDPEDEPEEESADEEEEPPEEEEGAEEKKEKNYDNYETDKTIIPSSFVQLEGDDDFLKNRVKELPQETVEGTHWNDADMDRRLKDYRAVNNSEVEDPALIDFFKKYDIGTFNKGADEEEEQVLEACKIFIERHGRPFNYMTFDEDKEAAR